MIDFADAISDSQLVDPGFDGPLFTWARGLFRERLDRILIGESWTFVFPNTRVTHLPRIHSDHGPLLVKCSFSLTLPRASFRFQNMWTRHYGFVDEVASAWAAPTGFSGMLNLQFKLARTKKHLKVWNKSQFGDIFQKVRDADAEVSKAQILFDSLPTAEHRANLNMKIAEYVLCTRMEEDFWKQKAAIRWATEGERNTKFFQGWVKQKRCKSRIHCIQEADRVLFQEDDIRDSAVSFFHNLLSSDIEQLHEPDLDCLHPLPAFVDKDALCGNPSRDEIKTAVFGICGDSVSGPDGFSSTFFQFCWAVVGDDVVAAVDDFFIGSHMPRSFTATTIILLPKKSNPQSWTDFRPISLCNVTNKIISKLLTSRLAPLLPLIVSPNQSGFVKGRLLSDNVLLAQEMIKDLKLCRPTPNVAFKLDMAKAYDRVQWPFLMKVMARMGFPEKWLSLVHRCVKDCWFSVLINGSPAGFFPSTRGLRQGDPLSPSLFVLAADYLSRSLDKLFLSSKDMAYRTERASMLISHLAYADDIIIFSQAKRESLISMMSCLDHYQAASGQKINQGKSNFYIHHSFVDAWQADIEDIGGFQPGSLPFFYLGVPIYKGFVKSSLFLGLRQKMSDRIFSWSHRHLSFGGRLALIKSTLATIPLHILQVMEPPQLVLRDLEQMIARFFWGSTRGSKKMHWVSWKQICLPVEEGGLGIRRFGDLVRAFSFKLWWRFRNQDSLWAQFVLSKYCFRQSSSTLFEFTVYDSRPWKRMIRIMLEAQQHIRWSVGDGKLVFFWHDIWFDDLPLSEYLPATPPGRFRISFLLRNNAWKFDLLHEECDKMTAFVDLFDDICRMPVLWGERDVMRWSLTANGEFSLTSVWEKVRYRRSKRSLYGAIWNECLLPTMSVFLWRLLLNRLPVDVKLQSRGISLASRCTCCQSAQIESLEHVFLWSESARSIWAHFSTWLHIAPHRFTDIAHALNFWRRRFPKAHKLHISFIIPCLVLWFIWSERNNHKHRGTPFRTSHVIWQVNHRLHTLVLARKVLPVQWLGTHPQVPFMPAAEPVRRSLRSTMVSWRPPDAPWVKLDTDGSFDRGAQRAAGGGLVRDFRGDLLAAFCSPLQAASSFEAELHALLVGLRMAAAHSSHVWIEMDAAAVLTLLTSGRSGPAKTRHTVAGIRLLLRDLQVRFSHIHREGNRPADFLARHGHQVTEHTLFDGDTAPRYFLALVRMDQLGYPNFRFRYL